MITDTDTDTRSTDINWQQILKNIAINEWRHYSRHVVFVDNPIYIEGSYSSDVNVEQLVCTREIFQYPEAQQLLQMYFKNGDNHIPVSILGERRNHSMLTPVPAR